MFGLTFEKLLLVGLIAAVVIGPHRLPGVVARFASLLGGLRRTVDTARERAAIELGVPVDATEWRALDPRRYDPRRIIAEALAAPAATASAPVDDPEVETDPIASTAPDATGAASPSLPAPSSVPMRRIRVGTSAHPRWIEVPVDDPSEGDGASPSAREETVRVPVTT